jgi:hypothetical protein
MRFESPGLLLLVIPVVLAAAWGLRRAIRKPPTLRLPTLATVALAGRPGWHAWPRCPWACRRWRRCWRCWRWPVRRSRKPTP